MSDGEKPEDPDLDGVPMQLPWGLSSLEPSSREVLQNFVNIEEKKRKKTPFQKHIEEQKAREEKQKAEVSAVYSDFVSAFNEDDRSSNKKKTFFVRGETVLGQNVVSASDSLHPLDRIYDPQRSNSGQSQQQVQQKAHVPFHAPTPPAPAATKKKRAIEELMEELEGDSQSQSHRPPSHHHRSRNSSSFSASASASAMDRSRAPRSSSSGSGDPTSTNVYIGNLSPEAREDDLFNMFSRFGPIAAVKIVSLRNEENTSPRYCGFVTFMEVIALSFPLS